jgi:hypothetical protein
MERVESRESMAMSVAASVLAAGAALLLGIGDAVYGLRTDAADAASMVMGIMGWAILVWAVVTAGAVVVSIGRRVSSAKPVSRAEAALTAVTIALIAVVVATHPLWGSGSATA